MGLHLQIYILHLHAFAIFNNAFANKEELKNPNENPI